MVGHLLRIRIERIKELLIVGQAHLMREAIRRNQTRSDLIVGQAHLMREAIRRNQMQSDAIRCNQTRSDAIIVGAHLQKAEALTAHQSSSTGHQEASRHPQGSRGSTSPCEKISRNQSSSELIRAHQWRT